MMNSFYLVWNPEANFPKVVHADYSKAVAEATRLANANPGQQFHVMAVAGTAFVEKPVTYRESAWFKNTFST